MFKLVDKIEGLRWPVSVPVPQNDGVVERQEFTAIFTILQQQDYEKFLQNCADDSEFISKFMTGWEGIVDEEGKAIPFTKARLTKACKWPNFRTAILRSYTEAAQGVATKN